MVLNIENLGIVKKAQIDLSKKFILFCGRNSTGKTYTSYVLQAFLDGSVIQPMSCTQSIYEQLEKNGSFRISKEYIIEWLECNCATVVGQTGSVFGISDAQRDKLFSSFSLNVIYSDIDFQELLETEISLDLRDDPFLWKISKPKDSDIVSVEVPSSFSAFQGSNSFRSSVIICQALRYLALCNRTNARMLPVERNSIYTFKTELSLNRNELIDQIQQTGKSEIDIIDIISRSSRRYPQPVRNSLRIANDLENIQKYSSQFSSVADYIEKDLLLGEVSMTKSGDVEFHSQGMAKSKRLPFHLSSSMVKTMASLIIYLRHIAKIGDTLIIDEPEMNFHPDVQVLLAPVFAILSAKGLRIIVSTHSDYIVREVNNLIMAHSICKKGDDEYVHSMGYSDEMLLDYKDVSVMYFDRKSKSSVYVSSLSIDQEGFAVESIDDAISRQNERAENLYAHLYDNE